ncbi:hypothetical protein CLU79DRAFT_756380 [Phycomyces nitens]|nr:hypothetical protein CLU79DRAFT_756380 [Phycomyces nitens]
MRLSGSISPTVGLSLVVLTVLQLFAILIFLKGFLLTRQTLDLKGRPYQSWERFPLDNPTHQSLPIIPSRPPFKRLVIILIDALRFDFVTPSDGLDQHYLNQVPIIHHLQQSEPSSSLLFQFRADPPTTTMQRVKGLMTGSLPTFIDAGTNFASSAVGEDHVLRHVSQKYKEIYFMGDDTWVNLFPETFDRENQTFASDSFKMFDLDTVDNRILSHLWPLMENGEPWEVAIAHFLGVDHCGHTYGPSHPNMARKLKEMNAVIERLVKQVDQDTLLVVMGDHGMSVEGDHGGESVEELMSALFLYSGRNLTLSGIDGQEYFHQLFDRIHHTRSTLLGYDLDRIRERLGYNPSQHPIVSQINLVPTLSYLLGIPIPFGNLGAIVPDIIYPLNSDKFDILLHIVQQFRTNALQVYDYLDAYGKHTNHPGFALSKLHHIIEHFHQADQLMLSVSHLLSSSDFDKQAVMATLEDSIFAYDAFLIETIKYCEAIWAQFDVGCMAIGIGLLFSTLIAIIWLVPCPTIMIKTAIWVFSISFLSGITLVSLKFTLLKDLFRTHGWFEKMDLASWIQVVFAFAVLCIVFSTRFRTSLAVRSWVGLELLDILQSLTLGSNSFVIWEDRGTRFMAATLCIGWLLIDISSRSTLKLTKTQYLGTFVGPLVVLTFVRLTGILGQCREEQFPHCSYIHNGYLNFDGLGHTEGAITTLWIATTLFLVVYMYRFYQRHALVNTSLLSNTLSKAYLLSLCFVLARQYFDIYQGSPETVAALEQHIDFSPVAPFAALFKKAFDVYMPRMVYFVSLFGTIGSFVSLKMRGNRPNQATHTKKACWATFCLWSVSLGMLQRPLGSIVLLAFPSVVAWIVGGEASSLTTRLYLLHVLGQHLFFVTAHQATSTSLPWKAAFIGFDDMNYYGGMVLVTMSTLAGHIASWLGWMVVLVQDNNEANKTSLFFMPLMQAIPTCFSALFVLILRRHLMTWKIFAPRFLLQCLLVAGSHVAAIFIHKIPSPP